MERQEHPAPADGRDADGRGPDGRDPDGRGPDGRDPDGRDKEISVTQARQAVAPHIVRYVLGIGLVLAVVALGLTLILGGV